MNDLKAYRQANQLRQSDLAEALGVEQATISRIEAGTGRPSLGLAILIEKVTGGAVPVQSWQTETGAAQ